MTEPSKTTETKTTSTGNAAVPHQGDHDRVTMLSLNADGTPDQHNPEIIGDKDDAVAAAKVQFAQQAVAAVDVQKRPELGLAEDPGALDPTVQQDKGIAELTEAHEKASSDAEKAAEKAVDALYQG